MTEENSEIYSPINFVKKSQTDLLQLAQPYLSSITYMHECYLDVDLSEYNLPLSKTFYYQEFNKTFLITKRKNGISIKLVANFIVLSVRECILIHNDKSGKKPCKYYMVTLINSDGKVEKDVIIANNSKSDYKQFQNDINILYNNFVINMTEAEFKSFVAEFISPKVASIVTIYTNAGLIKPGYLLYKNALATQTGIIWADSDGYIQIANNSYIKLEEGSHCLPELYKSEKTGVQILKDLMINIRDCWGKKALLPLLALGNMVMALYYEEFVNLQGVPTLILYGETGTGKSTIANVGLSIFGFSKDAITSGGSTAKSNEFLCSKYNCMNVCIDDVKAETLLSSNFTSLVKSIYKAIPRARMTAYGKKPEYIHTCSPLTYSTNEALPELREVINRINIIEMFGKAFKADKFNYHENNLGNSNNLKELSLILPEFLKYDPKSIIEMYNTNLEHLESFVKDTQKRVLSNFAYAITGIDMLLYISDAHIFDCLHENIKNYVAQQVKRYEDIQTPVDKVLSLIVTLCDLKQIEYGQHFKIAKVTVEENIEYHIRFKKKAVLSIINKYYVHDKNNQVNETSFNSYAQNHSRYRGCKTVRFEGDNKPSNATCFNVTDLKELQSFYDLQFSNTL